MEEKLLKLYNECIEELKSINIDILNQKDIGIIDIKIASRNAKRYGCCKNEEPDKNYYTIVKRGRRSTKRYEKFAIHHIEISKWVLELDDKIIKNTIIHELIHCIPGCNNHGNIFKKYAKYINDNLGYNISRLGNKEEDFKKSNIEYKEKVKFKYEILCTKCGIIIYRQRLKSNLIKKYRCGKCGGKLKLN